jgi:predicted TIM-barrel fold metal-dependent hydrolase
MASGPRGSVAHTVVAVDAHAHVLRRDAALVAQRHSKPLRDATVEQYIAVLDAHGVSHAVLTAPSFYGPDNSLLLEALDGYPMRLRGTVIVDPGVDELALSHLAARGVVGIRLYWLRRDTLPDLDGADYRGLLARVQALGLHVEIYVEGPKLASVLPRLRASGARVVVDHFGAPDPSLGVQDPGFRALLAAVRAGDTFVKLSAPYRLGGADPQLLVDALLDAGGPAQLVWASDWPFVSFEDAITYRRCLDWIAAWIPDESARCTVLVDTPRRLFGFDRAAGKRTDKEAQR